MAVRINFRAHSRQASVNVAHAGQAADSERRGRGDGGQVYRRLRGRSGVFVLALVMSIAAGAAPMPAMATTQPAVTFRLRLDDSCSLAGQAPANKAFFVELLRSDGVTKGKLGVASDGGGSWWIDDCFDDGMVPGDKIKTTNLGANNRTFVVPNVRVSSDRAKNRLWGKAPAGSAVHGAVDACALYSWQSCSTAFAVETAAANGSFNLTGAEFTPKVNPRGGDIWWVEVETPSGDMISVDGRFAMMQMGSNGRYWVMGLPGTPGTLELRDSNGVARATASFLGSDDWWGGYFGQLRLPNGNRAYPVPGETIWGSFASDTELPVPAGPFAAIASTDTVSGKCYPNQAVLVFAYDPTGSREDGWSDRTGKTDASGNFALKMKYASNPGFNLMRGDRVEVFCRHVSGDEYYHFFRAP